MSNTAGLLKCDVNVTCLAWAIPNSARGRNSSSIKALHSECLRHSEIQSICLLQVWWWLSSLASSKWWISPNHSGVEMASGRVPCASRPPGPVQSPQGGRNSSGPAEAHGFPMPGRSAGREHWKRKNKNKKKHTQQKNNGTIFVGAFVLNSCLDLAIFAGTPSIGCAKHVLHSAVRATKKQGDARRTQQAKETWRDGYILRSSMCFLINSAWSRSAARSSTSSKCRTSTGNVLLRASQLHNGREHQRVIENAEAKQENREAQLQKKQKSNKAKKEWKLNKNREKENSQNAKKSKHQKAAKA